MVDTPLAAVEAAPIVAQIAPTAPVEAVQAAAAVPAPVVAPVAETAPAVTPEAPKPAETILGEALKPVEPTPAPVQDTPPVEAKTTEGGQSDEPAPPPKYEPFTVPEGMSFKEERMGEFIKLLSGLELEGKANHDFVQKFGQEAMNFHITEVQKLSEDINASYKTAFEKQKTDWKTAVLSDPEMGGNRIQTTVDTIKNFLRTHGGTAEQQAEFTALMETSGQGNNPVMLRLLYNAGKAMSEGRPLAANKAVPTQKSKVATMYGNK